MCRHLSRRARDFAAELSQLRLELRIASPARVIEGARRNGALAGKVCGAGGGGCVVLLIEPDARTRVEAAIVEAGGEILPVTIDRQGVQVISR